MDINLFSRCIKELILSGDEVTVPFLGLFTAELMPASFSDRRTTINPPYRRLSFKASNVTLSEGQAFTKYVSALSGVSISDVKNDLRFFVASLNEALAGNRRYDLPGLGVFRSDFQGNIFFIADEDLDIYPEGVAFEPICIKLLNLPAGAESVAEIVREVGESVPEPVQVVPEPVLEKVTPELESEPESELESEKEPGADPVVTESGLVADVSEKEYVAVDESETELYADPESEQVSERESEQVSESEPVPERESEQVSESESVPEREPESESEPVPEQVPESEPEPMHDTLHDPESDSEFETEAESLENYTPRRKVKVISGSELNKVKNALIWIGIAALALFLLLFALSFFLRHVPFVSDTLDVLLYSDEELDIIRRFKP